MSKSIPKIDAKKLTQDRDQMRFDAEEAALGRVLGDIDRLGLRENLLELQTIGYTTVKGVLSDDQIKRAKTSIQRRFEESTGKKIDLDTATEEEFGAIAFVPYMLFEDPVFEEILLQPRPLALTSYLVGESCVLSSMGCHFKGPGEEGAAELHSDNAFVPMPYPAHALVCNTNYALTPYSKDLGALAIVPRSHLLGRQPTTRENKVSGDAPNRNAIPLDLSPGDAVVWHGNTWHGSFPRKVPGIRMNLSSYFARYFLVTQEKYTGEAPDEVLERNADNPRFRLLMGDNRAWGYRGEGTDPAKQAQAPKGMYD